MRIMYTYGENESSIIEEVSHIELVPAWNNGDTDGAPTLLEVNIDDAYLGEYPMDGSMETYHEAVKKFNHTLTNLLMNGWCYAEDFGCKLEYKDE